MSGGRASIIIEAPVETRLTTGVRDRRADLEEGAERTLAALKRAAEGTRQA